MSDLHRTTLYVVNGIVCDHADYYGKYPDVFDVRCNWRMSREMNGDITDDEIRDIIRMVERQDMGLWN